MSSLPRTGLGCCRRAAPAAVRMRTTDQPVSAGYISSKTILSYPPGLFTGDAAPIFWNGQTSSFFKIFQKTIMLLMFANY